MILAKQIEFQTSFPIHTRFDFHAYQILNFSISITLGSKYLCNHSYLSKSRYLFWYVLFLSFVCTKMNEKLPNSDLRVHIKIRNIPNLQIQRMDISHRICHWQSWLFMGEPFTLNMVEKLS